MSDLSITIDAKLLLPIIYTFRDYFDSKYPCTSESNDGSSMPVDDEIRLATYNGLLEIYDSSRDVADKAYKELKEKIESIINSNQ